MNFRTIADLNCAVSENLVRLPSDVDIVVGIPRSGMLVASMICLYLNLPLADLDGFSQGKVYRCGDTKRVARRTISADDVTNVLVVEDSSNTGESIWKAREKLCKSHPGKKFTFLCAYVTEQSKENVDIWFEVCPLPRMFEWNFLHSGALGNVCFDIDGVLCADPTPMQNDDGPLYLDFIRNTPARVVPSFEIGYLVTSRLEKYREETEQWLERNGIRYRKLIMMQYSTMEERQRRGNHASFKAGHYIRLPWTTLFVESDPVQAKKIARLTGKAVFCTGNQVSYEEGAVARASNELRVKYSPLIRRLIPSPVKKLLRKRL